MKTKTKIRIKLILINILFELVINSVILLIAFIYNKIFETLLFYFSWNIFRYAFPKVFHFTFSKPLFNIIGCFICSVACFTIAIRNIFNINISIFSSVIIGIVINYLLYKTRDYISLRNKMIKETVNIYKLSEDELRAYAKSKHLGEMIIDTLVLRVIYNYKWVEIQRERNYTKDGIRYHKQVIEKKLNIKL